MEEELILRKILEAQRAMVVELRLLRQALTGQPVRPQGAAAKAAAPAKPRAVTPSPEPETPEPETPTLAAQVQPVPRPPVETAPPVAAAPPAAQENAAPQAPAPVLEPEAEPEVESQRLPEPAPEPLAPPARKQSGGMLTMDELADLGGQFLDPGQRNRAKVQSVDASDLSGSILDEIKAKNKAKRSAFAEFEKFGRDR